MLSCSDSTISTSPPNAAQARSATLSDGRIGWRRYASSDCAALSRPFGQTDESESSRSLLALFRPSERQVMRQVFAPVRLLQRREPLALMPFVFAH